MGTILATLAKQFVPNDSMIPLSAQVEPKQDLLNCALAKLPKTIVKPASFTPAMTSKIDQRRPFWSENELLIAAGIKDAPDKVMPQL